RLILTIFLFTCLNSFSQAKRIKVILDIRPEFIEDFKDGEVSFWIPNIEQSKPILVSKGEFSAAVIYINEDHLNIHVSIWVNYDDLNVEKLYGDCVYISSENLAADSVIHVTCPTICNYNLPIRNLECPKCHKTDKRIPINYGMEIPDWIAPKQKVFESYPGGCTLSGCDPTWYCKRDKTKF